MAIRHLIDSQLPPAPYADPACTAVPSLPSINTQNRHTHSRIFAPRFYYRIRVVVAPGVRVRIGRALDPSAHTREDIAAQGRQLAGEEGEEAGHAVRCEDVCRGGRIEGNGEGLWGGGGGGEQSADVSDATRC